MRRTSGSCAVNVLLLFVICCLWCHIQPAAGGKCSGAWAIHACAGGNGKRSDVDEDRVQATDLRADGGERPDIQDAREDGERIRGGGREGERREGGGREGGERNIGGYRGSREGDDDLKSDFNDLRRQLSDEVELVDIGNHRRGHSPRSAQLDSAIDRLRSLLGTTDLDVDDRGEAEEKREERQQEEEEPQRRTDTDTDKDRRYVVKESLTMLRRILDDIERRLDAPPIHHSVSKNKGHAADDTEDSYYSIEKRAVDQ